MFFRISKITRVNEIITIRLNKKNAFLIGLDLFLKQQKNFIKFCLIYSSGVKWIYIVENSEEVNVNDARLTLLFDSSVVLDILNSDVAFLSDFVNTDVTIPFAYTSNQYQLFFFSHKLLESLLLRCCLTRPYLKQYTIRSIGRLKFLIISILGAKSKLIFRQN